MTGLRPYLELALPRPGMRPPAPAAARPLGRVVPGGYRSLWAGAGTWVQCSPGTRQLLASARASGYWGTRSRPPATRAPRARAWAQCVSGHPGAGCACAALASRSAPGH